jgi:hypothetical protein
MTRKAAEESPDDLPQRPLKTGRGMLAKYGPVPSAEEIFHGLAKIFR